MEIIDKLTNKTSFILKPLKPLKALNFKLVKFIGLPRHSMPLEGILRDNVVGLPLEHLVALPCFVVSGLFFIDGLFLGQSYSKYAGVFFLCFGLLRYYQGKYVSIYKKYIKKPPLCKISVEELYKHIDNRGKNEKVFIGYGYRWTPRHTQRFYDLETIQEYAKYTYQKDDDPLGGKPHIHGVGAMNEVPFFLTRSDRIGHLALYGQSRVGKSRLLELIVEQDIAAGKCVFLIDPKGDKDLLKRFLLAAERNNRLDDVMILHLGFLKESVKYNPVRTFQKISEVASRISDKLPDEGGSAAFAQFAWRFLYIAASAMEKIGQEINIKNLKEHIKSFDLLLVKYTQYFLDFNDQEFKEEVLSQAIVRENLPKHLADKPDDTIKSIQYLEKYRKEKDELDEVLTDIISAYSYDKTYYDKITASLLPFLDQLTSLNDVMMTHSAEEGELILDEAIAGKKLVFFGLDGLTDNKVASAFGSMFFADLVSTAGKLYKEKENFEDVVVHSDEFNDVIGDDFIPLLNKAGGAGIQVCAYTQTDADIELGFGGGSTAQVKAMVAKGNFRSIAMMRVATNKTAQFFGERFAKVNVKYTTLNTVLQDSDSTMRGTTANSSDRIQEKEIPLIEDTAIMSQPVGQVFFAKNGNNIYHVRIPLIDEDLTGTIGDIEKDGMGSIIQTANRKELQLKKKDVIDYKKNNPKSIPDKSLTGISDFKGDDNG